ncbi:hypothetical protein SUGI_0465500 [Cryptomeria japonica]|uniref:uncharacterized protein LOC131875597 n=1 Tax=Cryptomeria japonica TaxID=3369 RepID=UPI002408C4F1|nr:uncharacterized protein LOC131875597 [Cryptomeria japonica]GLJ24381.1 hypothetical protein SUGI_0465500 [Cryptomeria japonica]
MDFNLFNKTLQCSAEIEATKWESKEKNKRPRKDDKEGGELFDMKKKDCKLRPPADDSEVEEFFGLVVRIQAMRKLFKHKQTNCCSAEIIPTIQNVGSKVINTKAPWKPSFVWEDFLISSGQNSPSSQRNLPSCTNRNICSSGRSLEPDMGSDKYKRVESFDLNIEASPEN